MEEAGGPLTTVELTTYDPEAQVDLPFDDDNKSVYSITFIIYPVLTMRVRVLWLILSVSCGPRKMLNPLNSITKFGQSHWLTDALSEFDSSCDTLIITANPITPGSKDPCLKFEAGGNYGSCEVRCICPK